MLDKTGTLTLGVSKVTGIVAANGASEEAILQFAVIAEQHSEHPLGEAIVRCAKERGVSPQFEALWLDPRGARRCCI